MGVVAAPAVAEATGAEMGHYRKKPVVIEAMRVPTDTNDLVEWGPIVGWVFMAHRVNATMSGPGGVDGIIIHTLEGDVKADLGDWIIKDRKSVV